MENPIMVETETGEIVEGMPLAVADEKQIAVYEPVMKMEKAISIFEQVTTFCKNKMTLDIDYGKIPGVKKPSLFKPGGEKLMIWFGLNPEIEVKTETIKTEKGEIISVDAICKLKDRLGSIRGWCQGNCNSGEEKYQNQTRWFTEAKIPEGIDKSQLESKEFDGNWGKYKKYKVETDVSPYTILNTLIKMSQKRAFVGAVLMATGTSEVFTHDVEDMADNGALPPQPKQTTKPKPKDKPKTNGGLLTAKQAEVLNKLAKDCLDVGQFTQTQHDTYVKGIPKMTSDKAGEEIQAMQKLINDDK